MRKPKVNTRNKNVLQSLAEGGGLSPLAMGCGWSRKRVPTAWKTQEPGTPYPCSSPLVGTEIPDRDGGRPSRIVACATPVGPSLLQMGRVSERRQCEGAFLVETPLGLRVPVTKSLLRERRRVGKPNRATCTCSGLPFPHRIASSPLCVESPVSVDTLAELSRDAYEGGERDEARFLAAARRAGGRGAHVSSVGEADALVKRLRSQREEMERAAMARAGSSASKHEYKKLVSTQRAFAKEMGWLLAPRRKRRAKASHGPAGEPLVGAARRRASRTKAAP